MDPLRDSQKLAKYKAKAEKFARSGKWKKALDAYQDLARLDPKNDRVMRRLGEIYQKTGELGKAREQYKRLAHLYAKNGFWAKAVSTNKLILQIDPDDFEVQKSIVEMYSNMGIQTGPSKEGGSQKATTASTRPPQEEASKVVPQEDEEGDDLELADTQSAREQASAGLLQEFYPCVDLSEDKNIPLEQIDGHSGQDEAVIEEVAVVAPPEPGPSAEKPTQITGDVVEVREGDHLDFTSGAEEELESTELLADLISFEEEEVIQLEDEVTVEPKAVRIPLFSDFTPEEFSAVMQKLSVRRVPAGTIICKEGDPGNSIFVIADGCVDISVVGDDQHRTVVAQLKTGEFFGEFGVLSDGRRHATVTAKNGTELMEITKKDLREISEKHPRIIKVLDEYYRRRVIDTILQQNKLFKDLKSEERSQFISRFNLKQVPKDSYLFKEGDEGNELYFVKAGTFEVSIQRDNDVIAVAHLGPGEFFGEIALLTGKKRTATVRSETGGELLFLKREDAQAIIDSNDSIKKKLNQVVLERAEDVIAAYRSHQELKQEIAMV